MSRDRKILWGWGWIILLAMVIVAQVVANRMAAHWRDSYRNPDPRFEQMGGKR